MNWAWRHWILPRVLVGVFLKHSHIFTKVMIFVPRKDAGDSDLEGAAISYQRSPYSEAISFASEGVQGWPPTSWRQESAPLNSSCARDCGCAAQPSQALPLLVRARMTHICSDPDSQFWFFEYSTTPVQYYFAFRWFKQTVLDAMMAVSRRI